MRFREFLLFTFSPLATLAANPVVDCREAHASDPEAHIACLEAALQAPGVQPAADTQASAEPTHAGSAPAIAEAEPTLAAQIAATVAAEPALADGASETAVAAAARPAQTGMGAEQVRATEESNAADEELVLHIVGTSYNSRGLGTFRTEEGQVWRETTPSPERRRLEPDEQYTARIVRSKFGGYRMHVDGVKWMKTVERIE